MYICICKAISDKQLEEVAKTCHSTKEICKKLGLGSECGSCVQDALVLMKNSALHHSELKHIKTSTK